VFVLADDGQSGRVIEHVSQGFSCKKSPADECGLLRIPEGVVGLVELRNDSSLKVLFREVFDDVVAVGESLNIPPVAVAYFPVDDLDKDGPLLHLELLFIFLLVLQHHLDAH
jgi:hypothetical protein